MMSYSNHRNIGFHVGIACMLACLLLNACGGSKPAAPQPGPGEEPVIPEVPEQPVLPEQPRELAVGFEDGVTFTAGPIGLDMLAHDVDGDELPDIAVRFLGEDIKLIYNDSSSGEIGFDTSVASIETQGIV